MPSTDLRSSVRSLPEKFNEERATIIVVESNDEELLTKANLCERILKCDAKTAEKYYLNQPNFPYLWQGKRKVYPKKLVEKWIQEQVHYT